MIRFSQDELMEMKKSEAYVRFRAEVALKLREMAYQRAMEEQRKLAVSFGFSLRPDGNLETEGTSQEDVDRMLVEKFSPPVSQEVSDCGEARVAVVRSSVVGEDLRPSFEREVVVVAEKEKEVFCRDERPLVDQEGFCYLRLIALGCHEMVARQLGEWPLLRDVLALPLSVYVSVEEMVGVSVGFEGSRLHIGSGGMPLVLYLSRDYTGSLPDWFDQVFSEAGVMDVVGCRGFEREVLVGGLRGDGECAGNVGFERGLRVTDAAIVVDKLDRDVGTVVCGWPDQCQGCRVSVDGLGGKVVDEDGMKIGVVGLSTSVSLSGGMQDPAVYQAVHGYSGEVLSSLVVTDEKKRVYECKACGKEAWSSAHALECSVARGLTSMLAAAVEVASGERKGIRGIVSVMGFQVYSYDVQELFVKSLRFSSASFETVDVVPVCAWRCWRVQGSEDAVRLAGLMHGWLVWFNGDHLMVDLCGFKVDVGNGLDLADVDHSCLDQTGLDLPDVPYHSEDSIHSMWCL